MTDASPDPVVQCKDAILALWNWTDSVPGSDVYKGIVSAINVLVGTLRQNHVLQLSALQDGHERELIALKSQHQRKLDERRTHNGYDGKARVWRRTINVVARCDELAESIIVPAEVWESWPLAGQPALANAALPCPNCERAPCVCVSRTDKGAGVQANAAPSNLCKLCGGTGRAGLPPSGAIAPEQTAKCVLPCPRCHGTGVEPCSAPSPGPASVSDPFVGIVCPEGCKLLPVRILCGELVADAISLYRWEGKAAFAGFAYPTTVAYPKGWVEGASMLYRDSDGCYHRHYTSGRVPVQPVAVAVLVYEAVE